MENATQKNSIKPYSTNQAKLDFFAMLKSDETAQRFNTYYKELVAYNEKVNLTAITEESEVYVKHFYDSCLPYETLPKNATVVDVGTGAGVPGVPLKIIRPDIKLTLVDSLQKRVVFLDELCNKINIQSTNVHARAEDFALKNKAKFDVAVARAVAKLNTLLEYLLPLVKIGGFVLAYKGSNYNEELEEAKKALSVLGGECVEVKNFNLPNNAGERNIIIIKKIKQTPPQYPRGQNKPKQNPIV